MSLLKTVATIATLTALVVVPGAGALTTVLLAGGIGSSLLGTVGECADGGKGVNCAYSVMESGFVIAGGIYGVRQARAFEAAGPVTNFQRGWGETARSMGNKLIAGVVALFGLARNERDQNG